MIKLVSCQFKYYDKSRYKYENLKNNKQILKNY